MEGSRIPSLRPDEEKEAERIFDILMSGTTEERLDKLARFVVLSLQATHYTHAREIAEEVERQG